MFEQSLVCGETDEFLSSLSQGDPENDRPGLYRLAFIDIEQIDQNNIDEVAEYWSSYVAGLRSSLSNDKIKMSSSIIPTLINLSKIGVELSLRRLKTSGIDDSEPVAALLGMRSKIDKIKIKSTSLNILKNLPQKEVKNYENDLNFIDVVCSRFDLQPISLEDVIHFSLHFASLELNAPHCKALDMINSLDFWCPEVAEEVSQNIINFENLESLVMALHKLPEIDQPFNYLLVRYLYESMYDCILPTVFNSNNFYSKLLSQVSALTPKDFDMNSILPAFIYVSGDSIQVPCSITQQNMANNNNSNGITSDSNSALFTTALALSHLTAPHPFKGRIPTPLPLSCILLAIQRQNKLVLERHMTELCQVALFVISHFIDLDPKIYTMIQSAMKGDVNSARELLNYPECVSYLHPDKSRLHRLVYTLLSNDIELPSADSISIQMATSILRTRQLKQELPLTYVMDIIHTSHNKLSLLTQKLCGNHLNKVQLLFSGFNTNQNIRVFSTKLKSISDFISTAADNSFESIALTIMTLLPFIPKNIQQKDDTTCDVLADFSLHYGLGEKVHNMITNYFSDTFAKSRNERQITHILSALEDRTSHEETLSALASHHIGDAQSVQILEAITSYFIRNNDSDGISLTTRIFESMIDQINISMRIDIFEQLIQNGQHPSDAQKFAKSLSNSCDRSSRHSFFAILGRFAPTKSVTVKAVYESIPHQIEDVVVMVESLPQFSGELPKDFVVILKELVDELPFYKFVHQRNAIPQNSFPSIWQEDVYRKGTSLFSTNLNSSNINCSNRANIDPWEPPVSAPVCANLTPVNQKDIDDCLEMPLFGCNTCGVSPICMNCALSCHASHNISYLGNQMNIAKNNSSNNNKQNAYNNTTTSSNINTNNNSFNNTNSNANSNTNNNFSSYNNNTTIINSINKSFVGLKCNCMNRSCCMSKHLTAGSTVQIPKPDPIGTKYIPYTPNWRGPQLSLTSSGNNTSPNGITSSVASSSSSSLLASSSNGSSANGASASNVASVSSSTMMKLVLSISKSTMSQTDSLPQPQRISGKVRDLNLANIKSAVVKSHFSFAPIDKSVILCDSTNIASSFIRTNENQSRLSRRLSVSPLRIAASTTTMNSTIASTSSLSSSSSSLTSATATSSLALATAASEQTTTTTTMMMTTTTTTTTTSKNETTTTKMETTTTKTEIPLETESDCCEYLIVAEGTRLKSIRAKELTEVASIDLPAAALSVSLCPLDPNVIAVATLKRALIYTLSAADGTFALMNEIELMLDALGNNLFINSIHWIPLAPLHVAVVCNAFVKIYDVPTDCIAPISCFAPTNANDMFTSAVFVESNNECIGLLALSSGQIAVQNVFSDSSIIDINNGGNLNGNINAHNGSGGGMQQLRNFVKMPGIPLQPIISYCEESNLLFITGPGATMKIVRLEDMLQLKQSRPALQVNLNQLPGELLFLSTLPSNPAFHIFVHPNSGSLVSAEFTDEWVEIAPLCSEYPRQPVNALMENRVQILSTFTVGQNFFAIEKNGNVSLLKYGEVESEEEIDSEFRVPATFWTRSSISTNAIQMKAPKVQENCRLYSGERLRFAADVTNKVVEICSNNTTQLIVGFGINASSSFAQQNNINNANSTNQNFIGSKKIFVKCHGRSVQLYEHTFIPLRQSEVKSRVTHKIEFLSQGDVTIDRIDVFVIDSSVFSKIPSDAHSDFNWKINGTNLFDFGDDNRRFGNELHKICSHCVLATVSDDSIIDVETIKNLISLMYSTPELSNVIRSAVCRISKDRIRFASIWAKQLSDLIENEMIHETQWELVWRDFQLMPKETQQFMEEAIWKKAPRMKGIDSFVSAFL